MAATASSSSSAAPPPGLSSPPRILTGVSSASSGYTSGSRSSVQEKLRYAIDLLRKSELEKQDLLERLRHTEKKQHVQTQIITVQVPVKRKKKKKNKDGNTTADTEQSDAVTDHDIPDIPEHPELLTQQQHQQQHQLQTPQIQTQQQQQQQHQFDHQQLLQADDDYDDTLLSADDRAVESQGEGGLSEPAPALDSQDIPDSEEAPEEEGQDNINQHANVTALAHSPQHKKNSRVTIADEIHKSSPNRKGQQAAAVHKTPTKGSHVPTATQQRQEHRARMKAEAAPVSASSPAHSTPTKKRTSSGNYASPVNRTPSHSRQSSHGGSGTHTPKSGKSSRRNTATGPVGQSVVKATPAALVTTAPKKHSPAVNKPGVSDDSDYTGAEADIDTDNNDSEVDLYHSGSDTGTGATHGARMKSPEQSILETYIRFIFSPVHLLSYRHPSHQWPCAANAHRFDSIEWLRYDDEAAAAAAEEGGDEADAYKSIHSLSLQGHEDEDEMIVMMNTKDLCDADMQKQICIQLWTHSDDMDRLADIDMDAPTPQHDLLVQFMATIPELAEATQRRLDKEEQGMRSSSDNTSSDDDKETDSDAVDEEDEEMDADEKERQKALGEFFYSVEVVLFEDEEKKAQMHETLEQERLEQEIEKQREILRQEAAAQGQQPLQGKTDSRALSNARVTHAARTAAVAAAAAAEKRRGNAKRTGSSTPPEKQSRRASFSAPPSPTPPPLDDFQDLIMPQRVFARKQRMKAEQQKEQQEASTADNTTNTTGNVTQEQQAQQPQAPGRHPLTPRRRRRRAHNASFGNTHSMIQDPTPDSTQPVLQQPQFEPDYFRVRVTVKDLPKMNFHGTADSYFHILLDTTSQSYDNTMGEPESTLRSIYRSEVQFNQLNPKFSSFVLSSVSAVDREREVVVRMINWRQRVQEGHEEVIGEARTTLGTLIPNLKPTPQQQQQQQETGTEVADVTAQGLDRDAPIPGLTLTLTNQVRQLVNMKSASVGEVVLEYTLLQEAAEGGDGGASVYQLHKSDKLEDRSRKLRAELEELNSEFDEAL